MKIGTQINQVTIGDKTVITVNGKRYEVEGKNSSIIVKNNRVFVNGKELDDFSESKTKTVEIKVEGDVGKLEVHDGNATINGNVEGDADAGGDMSCKEVKGKVMAGGDVKCGNVGGSVQVGGDVKCGDVSQNVNAGGDVDCKDIKGSIMAGGDVNRR